MTRSTLSLHFSRNGNGTSLRVERQDPPWRAIRAIPNPSGEALVHLHNVSGGILDGDNLRLDINVAPRAQAQVATVGATRIHRGRTGGTGAQQETVIRVGSDALLEYLPDPVIPFARSRYKQRCEVRLADAAGLIWWETISAGRIAHGERYSFEQLSSETVIYCPQTPLSAERYSLLPNPGFIESPARMGPFLYSATMYVCRVDFALRWRNLEDELNTIAHSLSNTESLWGASTLAQHGVIVRGMACRAYQISQGLHTLWRAAKESIWGRPALFPRKLY